MEYQIFICRDPQEADNRQELLFQAVSLYVRKFMPEYAAKYMQQAGGFRGAVSVMRTEKGKPYLVWAAGDELAAGWEMPDLYFSISHSGGLWACLTGPFECGLDIQVNRPADHMKLASRYFSAAEQLYVEKEGLEGFYRIWCRREALAKYTGLGFFGMSGMDFLAPCVQWEGRNVWFHEIELEEGFTAVWCSEGEHDEVRCIR